MIDYPKTAPKIRELKKIFIFHKTHGDYNFFSNSPIPKEFFENRYVTSYIIHKNKFTGVINQKNASLDITLGLVDGVSGFPNGLPSYYKRDNIGYLRNLTVLKNFYGTDKAVVYDYGKRSTLEKITFVNVNMGLRRVIFSSYDKARSSPRVIDFDCLYNSSISYLFKNYMEQWLVENNYEKGDILSMSPQDYAIMLFECKLKMKN